MKQTILTSVWIFLLIVFIINFFIIISLENQLNDCRFEYTHLQTKLNQCQELSDYAGILSQILPPLAWGQLRALNEEQKQKRYWKYEGKETPLTIKK